MTVYLGIDIASKKFDAALLCNGNYRCKAFANTAAGFTALVKWTGEGDFSEIHACMEATGDYGTALATFLYEKRIKVSVVNPSRIKGYGMAELSRTKTDKSDSKLIARFCRATVPAIWRPVPQPVRILQALVRRMDALKGMLRMESNRADKADASIQPSLQRILSHLKEEIETIRQDIKKHISSNDELRMQEALISSVPGIGSVTGAVILSFMADKKFSKAKEVAAFLGLNPRHHQSGSSVRGRSRMSKTGNAHLRSAMYMPALVALKHNPDIRAFGHRLRLAGKPGMLIVGAAMRKLIHIIFGVLRSGTVCVPQTIGEPACK
ncbi:IS110 family transposase [Pantoea agglomerans]|jgi:transposase|uniref:IS110 family transposase n=1 Tax=Enterobacter agglomerans TaxID=549 RepID=A0A7X2STM3_ENTAG|nr:IS110 family transposase [Pantoea agglomerans]MSE13695.1 IS110 family transposase [Pantoea agglomerans]